MTEDMETASYNRTTQIIVAVIAALAIIVAAIIGTVLMRSREGGKEQPNMPQPKLENPDSATGEANSVLEFTEIHAKPERVNHKTSLPDETDLGEEEHSNFIFAVRNSGKTDVRIDRAQLIVDDVRTITNVRRTMMLPTRNSPRQGILVSLAKIPQVGDPIPIAIDTLIPANAQREISMWFLLAKPKPYVLYIKARLRIHFGNQQATSNTFNIEIHEDSPELVSPW